MRETKKVVTIQSCTDGLFIHFGKNLIVNSEKITCGSKIFTKAFREWIEDGSNEIKD